MLANEIVKNDIGDALKAWRKNSLILSGVGACYLFGVIFIGLKTDNAPFDIFFHLVCPLSYLFVYFYFVRKELKGDITLKRASNMVEKCFYCGVLLFALFFVFYVLKIASNDLTNGEVSAEYKVYEPASIFLGHINLKGEINE